MDGGKILINGLKMPIKFKNQTCIFVGIRHKKVFYFTLSSNFIFYYTYKKK